MVQSDALSQRSDLCPEEGTDNANTILLADYLFVNMVDTDLRNIICKRMDEDDTVIEVLKALKENGTPLLKSAISNWKLEEGLVFYKNRCYIPADLNLRQEILQKYHNSVPAEHPGQFKTLELLRCDYWQLEMYTFVKQYIEGCASCQQAKSTPIQPHHYSHLFPPDKMQCHSHRSAWTLLQTYPYHRDLTVYWSHNRQKIK